MTIAVQQRVPKSTLCDKSKIERLRDIIIELQKRQLNAHTHEQNSLEAGFEEVSPLATAPEKESDCCVIEVRHELDEDAVNVTTVQAELEANRAGANIETL